VLESLIQGPDSTPLERAKEHIERGQLNEAFEALTNRADPVATVRAHGELAAWLYHSRKDPDTMLACGMEGVRLGLVAADKSSELDRPLKLAVQILAYNVAANCWPGWGDEGIVLTANHVKEGLALAETSLSIVRALDLGPQKMASAHWLIGALRFSAAQPEAALASFDLAEQAFLQAEKRVEAVMARGYRFIVMKRLPETADTATEELERILAILSEDGSKPALFFARQLRTADSLL
jgi:hypothetical protein